MQGKENIPNLWLVAEEELDLGRRFLRAWSEAAARHDKDHEIGEKEGRASFPSIQGNTITGIDVVLDPAGPGAQ